MLGDRVRRDQHGQTPRPTTANGNHSTLFVKRDMLNDLQTSDNSNSNHDAHSTLDNRQLGGYSQIQPAVTMLAAHHDQENVYVHQAGASNKQLGAKTPGARYPKTPLKIPLNDENANHGLGGGKGGLLQTKGNNGLVKSGKQALVTPAAPQTGRAPLGNKTTNGKARATQNTQGGKGTALKTPGQRPTTAQRPKQAAPQTGPAKVEVRADVQPPIKADDEVEYCPPKPRDLPYESDVLPDGVLTFQGLKPENLFNDYYRYYFNRVDGQGKSALEREMEERQQRKFARGDEQIRLDMEGFDWSVGDAPESRDVFQKRQETIKVEAIPVVKKVTGLGSRPPSTIASRRAASALAAPINSIRGAPGKTAILAPKSQPRGLLLPKRKPADNILQPGTFTRDTASSIIASRDTLGYSKGRSASSAIHGRKESVTRMPEVAPKPRPLSRCLSTASSGSDATITPARFAQSSQDWKRPDFLSIFDVEDDDSAASTAVPQVDDEEEFQMSTDF
ncbi:hypothetical protein QC764_206120 [Podospora pseudoanserina]|uniref:Uncharacterized protein n=1 Tax=Podospora pseudoanserina TaxID=2609844 RepID=A0ABR0IHN9_9PEZI|nr:hypothetical protein QC764_206120 [Podospora pseudoanserina]